MFIELSTLRELPTVIKFETASVSQGVDSSERDDESDKTQVFLILVDARRCELQLIKVFSVT